jgi:exopolysaccharide production protein ExoQ
LVVLTDERPFEAVLTILRRCLYIHLPMSIVCIKYYRYIGVSFDWFGVSESWMGIATSKNTLGQVAMIGMLYFAWEIWRHWRQPGQRYIHFVYLAMAAYLLKGSEDTISLTSISVTIFALTVFYGLYSLRSSAIAIRRFTLTAFTITSGLILFVVLHSIVMFSRDSLFGQLIALFGRDVTLTDRTSIWSDVYAVASGSPLLGVGFGGFWIGRLANIPWSNQFTWVLGQAHSGYIDTYLQLGLVGVVLLAGVILTSVPRMLAAVQDNFDFACFRITFFLTVLFVNITETTLLRGDHHLWLVFLLVVWTVPDLARASQPAQLPIASRYESHGSPRL